MVWIRIHLLLEMFRFRREIEFMGKNQAIGKTLHKRALILLKATAKSMTKMLKQQEDIPYFELDNESIRGNIVLVIVYIAHEIKYKFLLERFLNYDIPKYFINSILKLYPDKCNHKHFVHFTRAVGNLAPKKNLDNISQR